MPTQLKHQDGVRNHASEGASVLYKGTQYYCPLPPSMLPLWVLTRFWIYWSNIEKDGND